MVVSGPRWRKPGADVLAQSSLLPQVAAIALPVKAATLVAIPNAKVPVIKAKVATLLCLYICFSTVHDSFKPVCVSATALKTKQEIVAHLNDHRGIENKELRNEVIPRNEIRV